MRKAILFTITTAMLALAAYVVTNNSSLLANGFPPPDPWEVANGFPPPDPWEVA